MLFPHRSVSTKRLAELGDVVHAQSMSMPGGCSYVAHVVRVRHRSASESDGGAGSAVETVDSDVSNAFEVLRDRQLYAE